MLARSMKIAVLSGIAATGVAGCSGGEVTMQPGRYEMKMTITDVSLPGAPPGAAEMMKEAVSKETQTTCLTAEDVKDPGAKLAPRQNPGNQCSENVLNWKGGQIDGKVRCALPQGEVSADMSGSYTADSFTLEVKSELPNVTGQGERGRLNMRSEGRRVGECTGSEKTK